MTSFIVHCVANMQIFFVELKERIDTFNTLFLTLEVLMPISGGLVICWSSHIRANK